MLVLLLVRPNCVVNFVATKVTFLIVGETCSGTWRAALESEEVRQVVNAHPPDVFLFHTVEFEGFVGAAFEGVT